MCFVYVYVFVSVSVCARVGACDDEHSHLRFDFNWAPVLESFDDDSAASWVFALVTKWCEWIRMVQKAKNCAYNSASYTSYSFALIFIINYAYTSYS